MSDVAIVVWKEWRELLRMSGSKRGALARHIFSVGIIGVIWPWQFGLSFVNSALSVALAAVTALMYIAGAAPDALAGERERHTLETLLASRLPDRAILLGKIIAYMLVAAAAWLCSLAAALLVFGLRFAGDPTPFLAGSVAFLFTSVSFGAMVGAADPKQDLAIQISAVAAFL